MTFPEFALHWNFLGRVDHRNPKKLARIRHSNERNVAGEPRLDGKPISSRSFVSYRLETSLSFELRAWRTARPLEKISGLKNGSRPRSENERMHLRRREAGCLVRSGE
jgi:hypothetical protein